MNNLYTHVNKEDLLTKTNFLIKKLFQHENYVKLLNQYTSKEENLIKISSNKNN